MFSTLCSFNSLLWKPLPPSDLWWFAYCLMVIFPSYYISIMVVSHKKWWCKHQKRLDIWLVNESMAGRNSSRPWFHDALTGGKKKVSGRDPPHSSAGHLQGVESWKNLSTWPSFGGSKTNQAIPQSLQSLDWGKILTGNQDFDHEKNGGFLWIFP